MGNILQSVIGQLSEITKIVSFVYRYIPITLAITLCSFAIAFVLGLLIAALRVAELSVVSRLARYYADVLRGIPLLVLIIFTYYGLGQVVNLPPFLAGVLAIGVCYSAYLSETFRAGIMAVPKGEYEAALSLGMTRVQSYRFILLPQATRKVIPPVVNELISMLKDSSLVYVISLREVTLAGKEYAFTHYAFFQTFLVLGAVYLVMTLSLAKLSRAVERRFKLHGYGVS